MSQKDMEDSTISKMANLIAVRSKSSFVNVSNPALAEKVEPGYLVKLASEIENSNNFVIYAACDQLKVIEEQMNSLRRQALRILVDTRINYTLNSLPCNFSKVPDHVYSVYRKPDSTYYISMISPEVRPHRMRPLLSEARGGCHTRTLGWAPLGSYRFESSMKWSPVNESSASSAVLHWIRNNEEENLMLENASANLGV